MFSDVLHDPGSGIDLILVRERPANPHTVLTWEALAELVDHLRDRYDHLVIDSAPVLGVTDSKFAAHLADAIILVIRRQQTSFDLVGNAMRELRSVPAVFAGAVITQVDLARHGRYRYGGIDNYYGKYQKYYVN